MKKGKAVFVIATVFLAGTCGSAALAQKDSQHPVLRFSIEEKPEQPVTLPAEVLQILRRDNRVEQCLAGKTSTSEFSQSWFEGASVQLSPKKQAALLVKAAEPCLLGANIGPFWVFLNNARGYALLLPVDAHTRAALGSKTRGHRDIRALAATSWEMKTSVFQFDGNRYRLSRSFTKPIKMSTFSQAQEESRKGSPWPLVDPLRKVYDFTDAAKAAGDLPITGSNGSKLDMLRCRTFGNQDDSDFDYSGDFECRPFSLYSEERYSTLLTENPKQSRDWESRGRFFAEELHGACGNYPEYGRSRSFRLRGMRITLTLDKVQFRKGRRTQDPREAETTLLQSFRFTVEVERAPEAMSEIAEAVPYKQPPLLHPERFGDLSRDCRLPQRDKK